MNQLSIDCRTYDIVAAKSGHKRNALMWCWSTRQFCVITFRGHEYFRDDV